MSFSQYGEDNIVAELFTRDGVLQKGTLLEIGAWRAHDLSNSRMLIEAGWDAVLCEFSPLAVWDLVQHYGWNERVAVVQAAITPGSQNMLPAAISADPISVCTDKSLAAEQWPDGKPKFPGRLHVAPLSIDALIATFLGDRRIDFASIDTEGTSVELAIALAKTDWRPRVMCVEHDGRLVWLMGQVQEFGYVVRRECGGVNAILERM